MLCKISRPKFGLEHCRRVGRPTGRRFYPLRPARVGEMLDKFPRRHPHVHPSPPRFAGPDKTARKPLENPYETGPEIQKSRQDEENRHSENAGMLIPRPSRRCNSRHQDADIAMTGGACSSKRPPDSSACENTHTGPSKRSPSNPRPPMMGRPTAIHDGDSFITDQDLMPMTAVSSPALRAATAVGKTLDQDMNSPAPVRPSTVCPVIC